MSSYYENNTLVWLFYLEESILLPRSRIPILLILNRGTRILMCQRELGLYFDQESVEKDIVLIGWNRYNDHESDLKVV